MVLVKNNSDKDINLGWGPYNYNIPAGGELQDVPSDVVKAMKERYKDIEVREMITLESGFPMPEVHLDNVSDIKEKFQHKGNKHRRQYADRNTHNN